MKAIDDNDFKSYHVRKYSSDNDINFRDRRFIGVDNPYSLNLIIDKRIVIRVSQLGFCPSYVEHIIKVQKIKFEDTSLEHQIAQVYDECCESNKERLTSLQFLEDQCYEIEEEMSYLEKILFSLNFNWLGSSQDKNSQNRFQSTENTDQKNQSKVDYKSTSQNDVELTIKINQKTKGPKLLVYKGNQLQIKLDGILRQPQIIPQDQNFLMYLNQNKSRDTEVCLICCNDINKCEMFAIASCGHRFCQFCIIRYIENRIKNGNVMRVNCPMQECTIEYSELMIENNVTVDMWEKYLKFRQKKLISLDNNVRWCPKIDCELYVIRDCIFKKLVCKCGQEICFDCGSAAHPKLSCENALDQFYRQAKQEYSIHPCPNCKAPIQKSSGCNHMTCYHCQHEFCWICMGNYSKTHYRVWNLCGCIIPRSQYYQTEPWKNANLWKLILFIPKMIGLILLLTFLAIVLLIPLIIQTVSYPYRKYRLYWPIQPRCVVVLELIIFILMGVVLLPITLLKKILYYSCDTVMLQHLGNGQY